MSKPYRTSDFLARRADAAAKAAKDAARAERLARARADIERGRTGQPPSLFKVEPGGRRDRGGVVAPHQSRVGRRFDDEAALAAHGSSYRSGNLLRCTGSVRFLRLRSALSSTRQTGR